MRVALEDGDRSGVVPWLRGVEDCGIDESGKGKIPTPSTSSGQALNRKERDLGWGTRLNKNMNVKLPIPSASSGQALSQKPRRGWGNLCLSAQAERGPKRKNGRREMTGKRRGEMAEAAFVAKVTGLGFGVAKPWGDSDPYDFIVQSGGTLARVQVKSAHVAGEDGCYSFRAHGHAQNAYSEKEIDVLVAYVVPEEAWYVFPVSVVQGVRSLKLFPRSRKRRSRFERYREAWWVLEVGSVEAAESGRR